MKIYLPDRDYAIRRGFKYHIQWMEDGNVCFFRRTTAAQAEKDLHDLKAAGHSPVIVDAITGEPANIQKETTS